MTAQREEIVLHPTVVNGDIRAPYDPGTGQLFVDYCFEVGDQPYRVAIPYTWWVCQEGVVGS